MKIKGMLKNNIGFIILFVLIIAIIAFSVFIIQYNNIEGEVLPKENNIGQEEADILQQTQFEHNA